MGGSLFALAGFREPQDGAQMSPGSTMAEAVMTDDVQPLTCLRQPRVPTVMPGPLHAILAARSYPTRPPTHPPHPTARFFTLRGGDTHHATPQWRLPVQT